MQIGAKVGKDKAELAAKQQDAQARQTIEGVRIGADVARNKAQMSLQERQAMRQTQAQANKPTPKKGD